MRPLFSLLKQGGFTPRCIIDVGANRGIWTRAAMKFFPEAHYTMVEPQERLKEYSRDLLEGKCKATWITAGVGDARGVLPLHVGRRDDSSSFAAGWGEGDSSMNVEVMTLNEIAEKHCPGPVDLVKIDAEGFDLKVLAGASELLAKTDVFLVEAVIFGTGQENTLAEVVRTMSEAGYRSVEITDVNRSPKHGVAWLCELAFLRNGCHWLDGAGSYE
jgi:FkbM family methyltransferase